MYKERIYQAIRLLLVAGGFIGVYFIVKYSLIFLYPFLLAILFTFMIHPFVTCLEKNLKFPRPLATLVIMMTVFIGIVSIIFFLMTELIHGTTYLAAIIPEHFYVFVNYIEHIIYNKLLPLYERTLSPEQQLTVNDNLKQFIGQMASSGATVIQNIFLKIPSLLTMLPYSITIFIFIVIATFLMTNDWPSLKRLATSLIPHAVNVPSRHMFIHFKKSLVGFVRAQLMIVAITALILCIGLFLFRIEHALTIVLIASIADFLPYIGTGIVFIPWIIYLFVTENYSLTINLSILYMFVIILRQIIEPKIISVNIGLKPLTALVALFIGFQLWGVVGILIAPILLMFVHAMHQAGIIKQLWSFVKGS